MKTKRAGRVSRRHFLASTALTMDKINERYETFKLMSQFEVPET